MKNLRNVFQLSAVWANKNVNVKFSAHDAFLE